MISDYDKAVEHLRLAAAHRHLQLGHRLVRRHRGATTDRTALWIVEEDGTEHKVSFAEMADSSDRVATWLRGLGVGKGDRVILMLGNQVELWEAMLAVAKLGAVIMPTTGALGPADLRRPHRPRRRRVRHRQRRGRRQVRRRTRGLRPHRRSAAPEAPRWHSLLRRLRRRRRPAPLRRPAPPSTIRCWSTSPRAPPSRPKLVEHSQVSYPVGHMSTMAWIGVRPGDVHLAISSPGWAKHAWSCFFAPWIAEATIFVYNYTRFDAAGAAGSDPPGRRQHLLRATDGVAHADSVRPGRRNPKALREILRRRRAAQPRRHRAGRTRVGADHPGRLRADRDHPAGRQHPGQPVQGRLDGPADAGRAGACWSTRSPGELADEGEICLDLRTRSAEPDDRLPR